MSEELPEGLPLAPDADVARRLVLAQEEINILNALREAHNEVINTIHRDLHEAAALIGDIHESGAVNTVRYQKLHKRVKAHVAKHGHPQDAPETDPVIE